jgi:putative oxidoreductase
MIGVTHLGARSGMVARKDLALVPTRATLGAALLYHGVDKLKDAGHHQSAQFFESVGIRPGHFWSRATGIAEAAAGGLSILGLLTRPAALAVLVTQAMAIAKVHAQRGFSNTKGGFEYNLTLMAVAAGLLLAGPGRFSLHEVLERLVDGRRPLRKRGFLARLVRLVK